MRRLNDDLRSAGLDADLMTQRHKTVKVLRNRTADAHRRHFGNQKRQTFNQNHKYEAQDLQDKANMGLVEQHRQLVAQTSDLQRGHEL